MLYHEAEQPGLLQGIPGKVRGKLDSQDVRRMEAEPADPQSIEGLDQAGTVILLQPPVCLLADQQGRIRDLQFDQQRNAPFDQG